MGTRHSVSALAVLLLLLAISACKKQRVTTLELRNLTPILVVYEGQVLEWEPESQSSSVTVTLPVGLCEGLSGAVNATHNRPAQCTIAKQNIREDEVKTYTYTLSIAGGGGDPEILVKRCTGHCQ
jgi:ABC-type oligopeptide transport system substrate-binding subunit